MARFDDTYPTRLRDDYDASVSRWLWLVKWLLLIPHFIVLFFLRIALFVVTVITFFAILFTGRYPRGLFDISMGVLRWSWRVGFYGYSALGADNYPPFSLSSRPDYPADFDVDFPERPSRGVGLVKWWLLAILHYLIIAAIVVSVVQVSGQNNDTGSVAISLFGVLIIGVFVALLFTGRDPRGLFDLLVGINRWIFRVWAYASLLRHEYPPFRLDQGPREPSALRTEPAQPRSDYP